MADKNKKTAILIDDLIQFTRENKIKWQYTNDDRDMSIMLYKILDQKVPFYDGYSTTDNCFYAKINNGYMLIIERNGPVPPGKYYLAVIPNIRNKVFEVYDSPQAQIVRLHSFILKKSPVEEYLDGVFNTFRK